MGYLGVKGPRGDETTAESFAKPSACKPPFPRSHHKRVLFVAFLDFERGGVKSLGGGTNIDVFNVEPLATVIEERG